MQIANCPLAIAREIIFVFGYVYRKHIKKHSVVKVLVSFVRLFCEFDSFKLTPSIIHSLQLEFLTAQQVVFEREKNRQTIIN